MIARIGLLIAPRQLAESIERCRGSPESIVALKNPRTVPPSAAPPTETFPPKAQGFRCRTSANEPRQIQKLSTHDSPQTGEGQGVLRKESFRDAVA